ncbi:MAG: aldehyde dehydrogenase family protein [Candidatus Thorarchaeota archaeon]|nr:aldehyde dehydrogenase family protein [Candidatus Thorarchaeota archaeon]
MEKYPVLVDGTEVDTGRYMSFPDMDRVVVDPGLAIALQMREAKGSQRIVFSKLPSLIPSSTPEMRYLRDYRRAHGVPKYSNDELDDVVYAQVCLARETDIRTAIAAGVRDHHALYNPFRRSGMGTTLDERIDALFQAGLEVKKQFEVVRDVSVKEGVPIKTFEWTWSMFTEYLERETFELWGRELDLIETPGRDGGKNYRFREPYGVACLFTPYNSPLALGILSITSSILAGNATILKPPSKVPLSTMMLGRIFMRRFLELGLPPAIMQVVTGGGKSMMDRFITDPAVGALVWYGDSETGVELWADATRHRIQMAPELAGSDASLVWGRDVDLEFAAKMIVKGRFLGSGQACMAVKRLLVQDTLHDDLVNLVVEEAERLCIGRPSDPKVSLPPVGLTALYLLLDQMEDALAKGAKVRTGGFRCDYTGKEDPAGFFYKPTVLVDASTDMRVMQEEVFAPALPVMKVSSVEQALNIANSSRFGLRSSIYTDDVNVRLKWAKGIEAAGVNISQDHLYFDPHMPHLGGYKNSGIIGAKYFPVMLTRMKYVHVGPGCEFM